jgi:hypothetical protein
VDSSLGKNIASTLQLPMQNGIHPFWHQFSLCPQASWCEMLSTWLILCAIVWTWYLPKSTNFHWFSIIMEITFMLFEIQNFIPFVEYLNKHKKMNIIGWLQLVNTTLFWVYINLKQNNTLKHNFCNLLVRLFLVFRTKAKDFKNIYDGMFIHNKYPFPYLSVNCFFSLLPTIEKLHQYIMVWCSPINL